MNSGKENKRFKIKRFVSFLFVLAGRFNLRRRKRDRRIIRQAKAVGVWDKPQALGGRALELKAWQDFKIKRKPGETDACLRRRCMNEFENEYAAAPTNGGQDNDRD